MWGYRVAKVGTAVLVEIRCIIVRNRLHDRRKLMFRECCLEDVSGGANDPNARWMDAASGEFNVIQVRDMLKGGVREQ